MAISCLFICSFQPTRILPGSSLFFFNDTATTEIYTLSLHDALPISSAPSAIRPSPQPTSSTVSPPRSSARSSTRRSEEHTSELQSRLHLVCRLLLEKKKKTSRNHARQPRTRVLSTTG